MSLLQTNRELRLWEYTVSLRQLLLRSPKLESGYANNLDVIFVGTVPGVVEIQAVSRVKRLTPRRWWSD
jgi:hypothetical protein